MEKDKQKSILKFAGIMKKEWKDLDSKKFIEEIRRGNLKADKMRFKKLEKLWNEK